MAAEGPEYKPLMAGGEEPEEQAETGSRLLPPAPDVIDSATVARYLLDAQLLLTGEKSRAWIRPGRLLFSLLKAAAKSLDHLERVYVLG